MMNNPFAETDSETLLNRKDELVVTLAKRLHALGLVPDYSVAVMARARNLGIEDRIGVLEALVEIEALKYTLAARRIREIDEKSDN
jgi:hypothetical protein